MNHEEWLNWRRQGIGSSDAAIIMGVSPWKTHYELWLDKVYGSKDEDNSSMARGRELEPVARRWLENTMQVCLFPKNKVSTLYPWIRASMDGMDVEDTMAVEIKCPNMDDHFVALNKMIPEKYVPQVQHQLLVTGLPGMYYCSFDGSEGAIVEVARDEAYIESMFKEEKKFWDMVNSKTPPELCERDYISMKDNQRWLDLEECWKDNKKLADELRTTELQIREELLALSNRRNAQGKGLKISKSIVQGNIDWARLAKDYPDIPLHKYRKNPYEKWTVRDIKEID